MLERLIGFALQQRVFVLVATAALALFGWNALGNLPIEAFPDVQDVQVHRGGAGSGMKADAA